MRQIICIALSLSFLFQSSLGFAEVPCASLLELVQGAAPGQAEGAGLLAQKRKLELALISEVESDYNITRASEILNRQAWERLLFLLARADYEEVLILVRPVAYRMTETYFKVLEVARRIEDLKKSHPNDAAGMANLRAEYQMVSVAFGEAYSDYRELGTTLESVANGKGLGDVPDLRTTGADKSSIIFALGSADSKATAAHVLATLDIKSDDVLVPLAPASPKQPGMSEYSTLFRGNIYALIGVLQKDLKEQQKARKLFKQVIHGIANFYFNLTSYDFIPERYRKVILKIAGVSYDQLMLERYLDKIQAIVAVGRARNEAGDLVINTDDQIMDLQVRTLLTYDATAVGDDLLITFARIAYHTDVWVNLMTAIEKKTHISTGLLTSLPPAPATQQTHPPGTTPVATISDSVTSAVTPVVAVPPTNVSPKPAPPVTKPIASYGNTASGQYADLLARMKNAEKRGNELDKLPYMYRPSLRHQLELAFMQLGYLVATEEGARNFLLPWVHSVFSHLHP